MALILGYDLFCGFLPDCVFVYVCVSHFVILRAGPPLESS